MNVYVKKTLYQHLFVALPNYKFFHYFDAGQTRPWGQTP